MTIQFASPVDDGMHVPSSPDLFFTETLWHAFAVPERNITGAIYPVFRPNQKICSAGVYLWDDSAEADHEILYSHNYWHLPLPETDPGFTLINGLQYEVIEPGRVFRMRYDSPELQLDLTYTGLTLPILNPKNDHLDQPSHITGHLVLNGERIEVDCYEMRDKSWQLRADNKLDFPPEYSNGSYTYGMNADTAFLARTAGSESNFTNMHGGWFLRDGVVARLVSGQREVEREPGRPPSRIRIACTDELGRSFVATGRSFNRYAFRASPGVLAWMSGMAWEIEGARATGEDQEYSTDRSVRSKSATSLWSQPTAVKETA